MTLTGLLFGTACIAFAPVASAQSGPATVDPDSSAWSKKFVGTALDLTGYKVSFHEDFNSMDITADGGKGPWFAPIHASYGAVAGFDAPGSNNQTYTVSDGILRIRAARAADGKWHGGNIETVDEKGQGFAQKYGYFEARMKFPDMPGAWPAFWLKSQIEHVDPSVVRPEIDVIEWYGGNPDGVHSTVHLWPPAAQYIQSGGLTKHWGKSNYNKNANLAGQWHTYGALITPELVTMYVDRLEVGRFPTFEEFKTPLYPLVSLTLYDQDAAKAVSPVDLQVDYVKIYYRVSPQPPSDVRTKK
jgi:beta-glucanase (GH16 family)